MIFGHLIVGIFIPPADNRKSWHNVTGSTVIAAHEGKAPQQIIIMAHLDTYAPLSDADADANLGGLTLQGMG